MRSSEVLPRDIQLELRRQPSLHRVERPTRLARARRIGYSAIQGIVVIRANIRKGSFRKPSLAAIGRRPKRTGIRKITLNFNHQALLERRISRRYPNMIILGSYYLCETGQKRWYEVILADSAHPSILSRQQYSRIISSPGSRTRQFRGLTASGRRARGL